MKRLGKSIKGYLLLAVVLCSVFANLFVNYAETHAAGDPATLYAAPEVLADAVASEYRTSLALCMTAGGGYNLADGNGDTLSAQHAATGPWFVDTNEVRPGILVWGNADDYISCYDIISHGAAKGLGFADNVTLACAVGLVRTDGQDCLTDTKQSDFTDKNINGDKNKVYANLDAHRKNASAPPTGGWNDAQRYLDVIKTMTDFCKGSPVANVGGPLATPSVAAQYHDSIYNVVDAGGGVVQVYYNVPDHGKKAMLMNFPDNFNWWEVSCGDLANLSSQYAPAYAAYVKAHPQSQTPAPTTNPNNGGNDTPPTCVITGIGWIVCPVMRFMAQVTDQAYGVVSTMLTTPALDTSTGGDMYKAWSTMRNFANVAFVIAFIIIIYAQITGFGVTNYGIKKLLPRIIVAAILVNVSYWICAIAVDISNILGQSLSGLLEGTANQLFQQGKDFTQSGGGGGWDVLTVSVIATAAGVALLYVGLSVLAPLLLMALLAIVTVVVVLTARQALIILLIVVSPLAFVAYLLPNTESWFKKWRELFTSLLMMFPIIALVFGASKLASTVIMKSNPSMVVQIMGAGVTIIPLVITPILMKTTTGILGKIGGFVNNPNKGPFDRMRKGAAGYRQNRQEYRGLKAMSGYRSLPGRGIAARRGAQREAVLTNRKSELSRSKAGYVAGLAESNEGFRGKLAQGGQPGADLRALAGAINIQAELQTKEVKAASAVIEHMNLGSSELNKLAMGGSATDASGRTIDGADDAVRKAAIQQAVSKGTVKDIEQIITGTDSAGKALVPGAQPRTAAQNKILSDAMVSSGITNKATHLAGQTLDDVAQGKVTSNDDLDRVTARAIEGGKYSAEKLADNDKDSLKRVSEVLKQPRTDISSEKRDSVKAQAEAAATNDRIKNRLTDAQKPFIDDLRT